MNKLTSYFAIALLGIGCVLYPFWWMDGYLDNAYLKISVAIACYGGLIANIAYLIKSKK